MANKSTLWGHKFTHTGNAHMEIRIIIPILLYISDTTIVSESGVTRMRSLHITPFLTFGVNWSG